MSERVGSRRGLTLIELVVALALLGLLAAVAVPAIRSAASDLPATANALAEVLERARALAVDRATVVHVGVDVTAGRYAVRGVGIADDGRLALPPGVRLGGGRAGRAVAAFGPLGQARCDPVEVARGAERMQVRCDPWSGAIATVR